MSEDLRIEDLGLLEQAILGHKLAQYERADCHARAEGIDLESVDVLESYDRVAHPLVTAPPLDLVDRLRGFIGL